jgi:hypothetical protein
LSRKIHLPFTAPQHGVRRLINIFKYFFLIIGIAGCAQPDQVMDSPGLHVLSEFANEHRLITDTPTEDAIRETIRLLDWERGFHQVFLVVAPGEAIEVGGSLRPQDGFSSVYRNNGQSIFRVTREPPKTIDDLEYILLSFYRGDGLWEENYIYDTIPY